MYRVSITILSKGGKSEDRQEFEVAEIGSTDYHDQMNDISDYLYELDIPFDIDQDGDMLLDDILMSLSEQEPLEEVIREKKHTYIIKGYFE